MGELTRTIRDTARAYARLVAAEWPRRARPQPGSRRGRHMLLIAQVLPPEVSAGVFRPTSLLRDAPANGWTATAIAREPIQEDSAAGRVLAETLAGRARVLHPDGRPLRPSWRFFPRVDGSLTTALASYHLGRRALADSAPSTVVATGPSFDSFVAAFYLARHFRAHLVLDYRDEWTECPHDYVRAGWLDRQFERRILASADAVLFTTGSQIDHQVAVFGGLDATRCHLLPNGWDPTTRWEESEGLPRDEGSVVVSFVGSIARHNDPSKFLSDVAQSAAERPDVRARLRLRFVGKRSDEIERTLDRFAFPEMIERFGFVPLASAQRAMREADVLVHFSHADFARYLPGKLFEYLATGTPVLIHGADGEAARLIQELGAGSFFREGSPGELCDTIFELAKRPSLEAHPSLSAWLAEHRRDALATRFYRILDSVEGSPLWRS